jgi:hypothetical protein
MQKEITLQMMIHKITWNVQILDGQFIISNTSLITTIQPKKSTFKFKLPTCDQQIKID